MFLSRGESKESSKTVSKIQTTYGNIMQRRRSGSGMSLLTAAMKKVSNSSQDRPPSSSPSIMSKSAS